MIRSRLKRFLIILGKPILFLLSHTHYWILIFALCLVPITALNLHFWLDQQANQIKLPPPLTSQITDRHGQVLYQFYSDENRFWVPLDKIPSSLVLATLAIEDKDFYHHRGVSWQGILRALFYNLRHLNQDQKLRGGSTITQQLVKNRLFDPVQTLPRKLREMAISLYLESEMSKNEILELYLNQIPYGGTSYGVAQAAQDIFGIEVDKLNLAQSAFLAALPASPSRFLHSLGQSTEAISRQHLVLDEMVRANFISQDLATAAKNQSLDFVAASGQIKAPHFVFYVSEFLSSHLGFDNIYGLGLQVRTTLDLDWQSRVEDIVAQEISRSLRLGISNGAAIVTIPSTGEIAAYVGSKNFFATDIDGQVDVVQALNQPGSAIKPINYLLAFSRGWSPASIINDSPTTFRISATKFYSPHNYTGKYLGPVTLRTALGSSLNLPSVKLLEANGISNFVSLAQSLGISSWQDPSRYGLSLALGSNEVSLYELSQAYSVFATQGSLVRLNPIIDIKNYLGETIYQRQIDSSSRISPKYPFLVNSILSDNQARTPIFGPNSLLRIPSHTVAVKTGTTNQMRDNWCFGWTPSVLVGVWVGNNDNRPMLSVASGISGATPIWRQIMDFSLLDKPDQSWPEPAEVYRSQACGRTDYFTDGTESKIVCPTPPSPTSAATL